MLLKAHSQVYGQMTGSPWVFSKFKIKPSDFNVEIQPTKERRRILGPGKPPFPSLLTDQRQL